MTDTNNALALTIQLEGLEQELRRACKEQIENMKSLIFREGNIHMSLPFSLSSRFRVATDLNYHCLSVQDYYKEIHDKSLEIAERISQIQATVSLIKDEMALNKSN